MNFLRRLALQEKNTWWQLASPCCWNCARRLTCFLSASVKKEKTCNSAHEQTPLSNDTIDSVLRQREEGRAKDLSVDPRNIMIFGEWCWPPTPSSAGVKERVQLYTYSPSAPSWPVLGWTLPFTFTLERYSQNPRHIIQCSLRYNYHSEILIVYRPPKVCNFIQKWNFIVLTHLSKGSKIFTR